jgi:N-acetylmuramoyl-L-alanine amidase
MVGVAKWGNNTDINSSSIGIEIDNNGFEPFETAQINSLLLLLDKLKNAI